MRHHLPSIDGLRDYGTGEWEGGEPDCDHVERKAGKQGGEGNTLGRDASHPNRDSLPPTGHALIEIQYRSDCGKCGARRVDQQIGLEETPDQWVDRLVAVFRECRRVLRDDGTLWVEIGDSYAGSWGAQGRLREGDDQGVTDSSRKASLSGNQIAAAQRKQSRTGAIPPGASYKPKDLLGQPWLLAFALRADGWYLRSEIIWARPNPMPESVTDRPTKSHSTVFLLSKSPRYFYDADAIRESSPKTNGRTWQDRKELGEGPRRGFSQNGPPGELATHASGANARSVWTIPTEPTPFAHFATWPQALVRRMILAGTSEKGCCPECGAAWIRETERETVQHQKNWSGSDRGNGVVAGGGHHGRTGEWASTSTTLGWSPSCGCKPNGSDGLDQPGVWEFTHEPVPCTVLDPFAGSGTTCLVARNHGRHAIGIELNETYLKIAGKRLAQLSLLALEPEPARLLDA